MAQYPEIDYRHVLSELSVNRKDPCEVIRELISNSYDAQSSRIEIYPLLKDKGFIYFDNGTGLSEKTEINGITPYRAFFSIGRSTKIQGDLIGYKCQGSKLCFASKKITLITRCSNEEYWRSISIDNPKDNLSQDYDIQAQVDKSPWETLRNLFSRPTRQTITIFDNLSEQFFRKSFSSGAIILVQGLEVEKFSDYYNPDDDARREWSYLKHYIRFNTRHGDMRCLRSDETGFSDAKAQSFKQAPGYNDQCELYLWTKGSLKKIEAGYPYLDEPDDLDKLAIKSPFQVSRLNDGRFSARGAMTFQFEDITYCLAIAIDGNRRAHEKYQELGRKGDKKSGIRLTDQRGTFICSEGVKICKYSELFEHNKLEDYAVLGTSNGESHYIFMINGSFDVVTNRNSLDEFNHPLILTDQIVCWEMPTPKEGDTIEDSYNYYGYISLAEELNGIGYEIIKIQSRTGEFHGGNIKVISLKNLLSKTFNCQWETPPRKATDSKKGKGSKKSK